MADPFHMIGGVLIHGFYDESRQLLFATNPGLNEVDVISGADLSVRARVHVPQPWGIDQMADGHTLVIGTTTQQIVTVDETTLSVTQHPVAPLPGIFGALYYPNVVALANGKVLIIGQLQGIESNNIHEGGQYILEWDSINNTFTQAQPGPGQQGTWEADSLVRSADHKWAFFSADQFYLYDSNADRFTTAPLTDVNTGAQGYAMNADGSMIAVASGVQVTVLDRSFNVTGATQFPNGLRDGALMMFSSDGSRLFLQNTYPLAIEVLDANRHTALGYYSASIGPQDASGWEGILAIDSAGIAFLGIAGGVRAVDTTAPVIANPSGGRTVLAGASCPLPMVDTAPLNTSEQSALFQPAPVSGMNYYFGGQPATVLSNGTQIAIPAASTAGTVDIECIRPDGNTLEYPLGFSYGVQPIGVSANLLPPTGNPLVYVFGSGFSAPSVTIGNQLATNVTVFGSGLGSLQVAAGRVPAEHPGQASLTLSDANGTGSLTSPITYVPSASVLTAPGLLQVLYDPQRDVLYALKATEVDVLDPISLQWRTPFLIPGAGGVTTYNSMALSPDGSELVVVSPNGYVAVLDPDTPSQVRVVQATANPGFQSGSVAITKYDKALMSGTPNLEIDLSTLAVRTINTHMGDLVRASSDGSALYGVDLNVTSGQVYSIDPLSYSVQSPPQFGDLFWSDLAVSTDGSHFAAVFGSEVATGDIVGFFNPGLSLIDFNAYPFVSPPDDIQVLGSTYSPGGKVLVVPLGDSIEFWDTATGTLRERLMTPEELHVLLYPEGPVAPQIALDTTGQTIFAISASGLTVLQLPQPVDNIPAQVWALMRPAGGPGIAMDVIERVKAMHRSKSSTSSTRLRSSSAD